jgi:hypothetical protein
MSWPESDEVVCFGWIDAVRMRILQKGNQAPDHGCQTATNQGEPLEKLISASEAGQILR